MEFPCHKLSPEQHCDRDGPDGFMGHTCLPPHDGSDETWRGIFKLIEELGEVQQLLGKACACPVGEHWDGKGDLRERLPKELADLKAAIAFFETVNMLRDDHKRQRRKYDLFSQWGLAGVRP